MQQLDSGSVHGWNPYAPRPFHASPTAPARLAYSFAKGEKLRYEVEYAWQVRSAKLNEFIVGSAKLNLEAYPCEKGFTLRCFADRVSVDRSSPKAPPFSTKTRADVLISPRGEILGLKWNGMVLPFRSLFWLSFPADSETREWQEEIDLGLPLLEKLRFPVDFSLESKPDAVLARMRHEKADNEASINIQGEVLFSRSKGYATRTAMSIVLKGRTEVIAQVKATYVDGPQFEEEAFLFSPR